MPGGVQKVCRYGTSGHGLLGMVMLGRWLDLMILEIFFSLNDYLILCSSLGSSSESKSPVFWVAGHSCCSKGCWGPCPAGYHHHCWAHRESSAVSSAAGARQCRVGFKDSSYDQYDHTKPVYCTTNQCLYSSLPCDSSNV